MKNAITLKEFNVLNVMEVFRTKTSRIECLVAFDDRVDALGGLEVYFEESDGSRIKLRGESVLTTWKSLIHSNISSSKEGLAFKMSRKGFENRLKTTVLLWGNIESLENENPNRVKFEFRYETKGDRLIVVVSKK